VRELSAILLPVAYFPPISYFSLVLSGHPVLIESGETYPKQTLRNRCEIACIQGKQILVVPVTKPSGNRSKTYEILESSHENWKLKHWRALETCYSSSPFFLYYADRIRQMITDVPSELATLDAMILEEMLDIIGLKAAIKYSRDFTTDPGLMNDCRDLFTKKGYPLNRALTPYPQVFSHKNGFIGDLSILDLLFNMGPETAGYLKSTSRVIL